MFAGTFALQNTIPTKILKTTRDACTVRRWALGSVGRLRSQRLLRRPSLLRHARRRGTSAGGTVGVQCVSFV